MMGLFYRRPLCFFAFLFVAFSLLAFWLPTGLIFVVLGALGLCLLLLAVLYRRFSQRRSFFLGGILAFVVSLCAVGYSFVAVTIPWKNAARFVGERAVIAEIVHEEYYVEGYGVYFVTVEQMDEETVRIPATLRISSSESFSPKDRIAAVVTVEAFSNKDRSGSHLMLSVEEKDAVYLQRASKNYSTAELLFSSSGIRIFSERCQTMMRTYMTDGLGERIGGLASAFFVGDRSALSPIAVRDFARSGVSHLMAVSGLHFFVLLGALELLLRRLFCPKKGRIVIVTLVSVFFLFLTGFSMSACRSALMLYMVYVSFLLQEESDAITSLFISLALIVLVSPYAIADLGLWMSFLATLGLLTVYPVISEKIPRARNSNKLLRGLLLALRECLMLLLMTVISTLFLLPILWIFFGEFSSVSLLSNLVLSPLSYAFLLCVPLWLLFSPIPWISQMLGAGLSLLGEGILWSVSFFSAFPSATISLHYDFCFFLIPVFVAAMIAVLILRLHRRWMLLLPPIAMILSFSILWGAVRLSDRKASVTYLSTSNANEMLWISDGDSAAFCDLSGGSTWLYQDFLSEFSQTTATELESVVLTHYHKVHPKSMDLLLQSEVVRKLYLPTPRGEEEREIATELWHLATEAGSEVIFYTEGVFALTDQVTADIEILSSNEHFSVALTLSGNQERLTYVSSAWFDASDPSKISERLLQSHTVLLGKHGAFSAEKGRIALSDRGEIERVIDLSEQGFLRRALQIEGVAYNVTSEQKKFWSIELP